MPTGPRGSPAPAAPSWPPLVGLLLAGACLLVLWYLPAQAAPEVDTGTAGMPRHEAATPGAARRVVHTWEVPLELEGPAAAYDLSLALPVYQSARGDDLTRRSEVTCTLWLDDEPWPCGATQAYVHGSALHTFPLGEPWSGRPPIEAPGAELRVHLEIALPPAGDGWRGEVIAGPLTYTLTEVDRDGDGVLDNHQPVPGFHTAALALPAALVAGLGGAWAAARIQARLPAPGRPQASTRPTAGCQDPPDPGRETDAP